MKTKKLISLLLGMTLAFSLLTGCGSSEPPSYSVSDLGSLSSFSANTLDGATFTQDDIQNKDVTIINFWGTTCKPCIEEMPDLVSLMNSLPDNIQLITVCLNGSGHEAAAEEILANAGYTGITLISGDETFTSLCNQIRYTPTTIFVDSDGNLSDNIMISSPMNLAASYMAAVNKVLRESGKAEISLEDN